MPRLARNKDHRAWHHRRGVSVKRGAALPFMHKEHLVLLEMPMLRDHGAGEQGFRPHGQPVSCLLGGNFNDHLTGRGWPELEHLALT